MPINEYGNLYVKDCDVDHPVGAVAERLASLGLVPYINARIGDDTHRFFPVRTLFHVAEFLSESFLAVRVYDTNKEELEVSKTVKPSRRTNDLGKLARDIHRGNPIDESQIENITSAD